MANSPSAAPRLLFVVDNDFGALGVVMYLLHGQEIASRATVLLPPGPYDLHQGRLGVPTQRFGNLRDVLDVVDREKPDAAFLVSAYLLAPQGVLGIRDTATLVRELRRRGCRVATTDPYIGTYRSIPASGLAAPPGARQRRLEAALAWWPWARGVVSNLGTWLNRKRLALHVARVAAVCEDLAHFYPCPMDCAPGRPARHAFFNPAYLHRLEAAGEAARPVSPHSWLFVLARFDYELQAGLHGAEGFADLVAHKLRETLYEGREPTFIGPAPIVEALGHRLRDVRGVTLLTRCPFDEFERRLAEAEVAFYWQFFPTSAFMRLWCGMPAYFLDPGHNARVLPALHSAGLERYYLGASPAVLDIDKPLRAAALLSRGQAFREDAAQVRRRLEALPSPAGMVEAILREP